jgi:hypothetical protein
MSEAKSLRKLDKNLNRAYNAVHEANELMKLQDSILCNNDEPPGGFGPSDMMIRDRVEIAHFALNKAIGHFQKAADCRSASARD